MNLQTTIFWWKPRGNASFSKKEDFWTLLYSLLAFVALSISVSTPIHVFWPNFHHNFNPRHSDASEKPSKRTSTRKKQIFHKKKPQYLPKKTKKNQKKHFKWKWTKKRHHRNIICIHYIKLYNKFYAVNIFFHAYYFIMMLLSRAR